MFDLNFEHKKDFLIIDISPAMENSELKKLKKHISYSLGLDEDLKNFYSLCGKDKVLKEYLPKIRQTRIVSAFSDFEALIGAIISQNNSYRNYRTQMRKVYRALNFKPKNYTEEKLKKLKLGYKTAYILELKKNYNKLDIKEIKGIGNYSVNLFNIFQKRDYNAFYVDCLTEKIMKENYGIDKDFDLNSEKLWGKYRGLAEAYLQRFFEKK
jgi:3-methyladenine DNA glycosylase/8-oxoguanine DNA glycosylase